MISKQKNEIEQLRGDLKSKDAELETKKTELKKSYEILEKGKNKLKDLDQQKNVTTTQIGTLETSMHDFTGIIELAKYKQQKAEENHASLLIEVEEKDLQLK